MTKRAQSRRRSFPCRGKRRYRDKQEATRALHGAQNNRRAKVSANGRTERRAYHCPGCNGWHLTSMEAAS